ncbi:hypothetical protein BGZ89_007102, partial [Linnemannia elongata]
TPACNGATRASSALSTNTPTLSVTSSVLATTIFDSSSTRVLPSPLHSNLHSQTRRAQDRRADFLLERRS